MECISLYCTFLDFSGFWTRARPGLAWPSPARHGWGLTRPFPQTNWPTNSCNYGVNERSISLAMLISFFYCHISAGLQGICYCTRRCCDFQWVPVGKALLWISGSCHTSQMLRWCWKLVCWPRKQSRRASESSPTQSPLALHIPSQEEINIFDGLQRVSSCWK